MARDDDDDGAEERGSGPKNPLNTPCPWFPAPALDGVVFMTMRSVRMQQRNPAPRPMHGEK